MRRERLVVVGAGMAAARLVREVLDHAPGRFAVELVGSEASPPYDRIQLSAVLAGERRADGLSLLDPDLLARHGVRLRLGMTATGIDRAARRVAFADGTSLPYDRLVLATGSQPIRLPLPGADLPGVLTFRDLADVERLAGSAGRAVVIGGGLLGLEAANGLLRRGLDVTVVHLMPWLMERQLDREAGALLRRQLERRGLRFALPADSAAITGSERVEGLRLKDGTEIPADVLVMAVGIRPECSLARAAGLACGRGVKVDDGLGTSDPSIFAVGECAEHRGIGYGLVAPLYEQAAVLARRLAGDGTAAYAGSTVATSLKVSGVELHSAGEFGDDAKGERLLFRDPARGVYRKLVLRDGRLAGAVLLGDAADGAWYADLIRRGADVEPFRGRLIFGRALCEPVAADLPRAA
jgi:nitrite reductase (NADH) large subunit